MAPTLREAGDASCDSDAVEDGAAAVAGQRVEGRVGRRCRRLEVREPANLHVECHELQTIVRAEIGFQLPHGLTELIEHRPGDAGADIESMVTSIGRRS